MNLVTSEGYSQYSDSLKKWVLMAGRTWDHGVTGIEEVADLIRKLQAEILLEEQEEDLSDWESGPAELEAWASLIQALHTREAKDFQTAANAMHGAADMHHGNRYEVGHFIHYQLVEEEIRTGLSDMTGIWEYQCDLYIFYRYEVDFLSECGMYDDAGTYDPEKYYRKAIDLMQDMAREARGIDHPMKCLAELADCRWSLALYHLWLGTETENVFRLLSDALPVQKELCSRSIYTDKFQDKDRLAMIYEGMGHTAGPWSQELPEAYFLAALKLREELIAEADPTYRRREAWLYIWSAVDLAVWYGHAYNTGYSSEENSLSKALTWFKKVKQMWENDPDLLLYEPDHSIPEVNQTPRRLRNPEFTDKISSLSHSGSSEQDKAILQDIITMWFEQ